MKTFRSKDNSSIENIREEAKSRCDKTFEFGLNFAGRMSSICRTHPTTSAAGIHAARLLAERERIPIISIPTPLKVRRRRTFDR